MIYSYTYEGWYETETRYLYVEYKDLIAMPEGELAYTPEAYYSTFDYGYDSPSEVLDERYDSDKYITTKIS